MTEDFLHYIWRFQALCPGPYLSSQGQEINVVHPGYPNFDSGPDFEQARVLIDGQLWVGSVEIHIDSKEWYSHGHQRDAAYQNVILHVVYQSEAQVLRDNQVPIPELVLKGYFDEQLYWRFEQKLSKAADLACEASFPDSPLLAKQQMLDRCAVQRLEERSLKLERLYRELKGDWDELLYRLTASALGLKVNKEPMEMLARVVPFSLWRKYLHSDAKRLALFLGMSGLLEVNGNEYITNWQREFHYLSHKHGLKALNKSIWKYARLRPSSFPDRRIAQLSAICPELQNWFKLVRAGQWRELRYPALESFWSYHYRLSKLSTRPLSLQWSEERINLLKINALVPLLFFYGRKTGQSPISEQAIEMLGQLPAERNKITKSYEQLGLSMRSAYDSQACISWYKSYCQPKKCLTCTLGNELLNTSQHGEIEKFSRKRGI